MYPNYRQYRKLSGYECLSDTSCGNRLVLITDSGILFVKNVTSNGNRNTSLMILAAVLAFGRVNSAEAIGTSPPPQQRVVSMGYRNTSKLIKASTIRIHSDSKPKIMMPSLDNVGIKTKSELQNSKWIKKFISTIRGGEDKELIDSIISKVSEDDWDIPSINKILQKVAEAILEIGTESKLLRILEEFEKPLKSSIFADAWVQPLPGHIDQNVLKKTRLDFAKRFGDPYNNNRFEHPHNNNNNMPCTVYENFEIPAVKRLCTSSLRNQRLEREYRLVKEQLRNGIHPVNIGQKSTYVSPTKVLIKKSEGRYLVEITSTGIKILGFSSRGNAQGMSQFQRLMNQHHDTDLKGY